MIVSLIYIFTSTYRKYKNDSFNLPVGLVTSLISFGQVKPDFVGVVSTYSFYDIESSFAESLKNEKIK